MAAQGQRAQDSQKHAHQFRDFGGVNTQASRMAIGDNEFAWLENVMPIGHGNLKAVPYQSASLATVIGTAYYMLSANIANVDYMFKFCADGSAWQINLSSYATTKFANAGTFNGTGTQACQWKNERILIIDPTKGYWSWDTSTLTQLNTSVTSVIVTAPGSGYTSRPNVTFTPTSGGSGAAATAIVGLAAATLSAAGSGYFVNNILTIAGGTYNTQAQIQVTSINGSGGITGFSILNAGDYTTPPVASPVGVTGGNGSGATFTPVWGVVSISMTSGGTGYLAPPTVGFSAGSAAGTAYVSVAPSGGSCIASYSGRVWVSSGRTVVFSAPNSYLDFSTTNAGGSFILTDETLHSNINQLSVANNFLYLMGDTSINVVSDVRVSSTTGQTIFSNTNVSASVGSTYYASITPYYRALWFANKFGIYALYGSTTQKGSDNLDGVFQRVVLSNTISAAQFVVNNILCLAFLVTYNDPASGNRPLLLLFFNKRWFFASQGNGITFIAGGEPGGVPTLYATDGTNLYKLFSDTSTAISQTAKTKLWSFGEKELADIQTLKVGAECVLPVVGGSIGLTVDTEVASSVATLTGQNLATWVNNSLATVTWVNNSSAAVSWLAAGFMWYKGDATNYGKYTGITYTTSVPGITLNALQLQYELRARW